MNKLMKLMLAFVLVFGVAGCGAKDTKKDSNKVEEKTNQVDIKVEDK